MKSQLEIINEQFTKQAPNFSKYQSTEKKQQFNRTLIEQMHLCGNENALEVAAGTCSLGRMLAPKLRHITELDATRAMLDKGKEENEKAGITNADYIIGTAMRLPFEGEAFDIVVSRLAFHHFENPLLAFSEMCRVLKSGGLLAAADMLARDEPFRGSADKYEHMRDQSHVRCLSENELVDLAEKHHLKIEYCSIFDIQVSLDSWMDLTGVKPEIRRIITADMLRDTKGGTETGFSPYIENREIRFDQKWLMLICRKS